MVSGVDRCSVDGFTLSLQLSQLKKIDLEAGFFSVPKLEGDVCLLTFSMLSF